MFNKTIRTAAIMFVAGTAFCLMSQSANAQSCGYGGGGFGGGNGGGFGGGGISLNVGGGGIGFSNFGGGGFGGGYGGYGGYNRGISLNTYRPSYRRPSFHNTTHLDYHPGGVVRHGNHFDYIPGHYDVHRTGHWHR